MNHMCIIGAGATGVATLREIIRRGEAAQVTLFDPRPPGKGVAFASPHDWHLCNTSVGTMSVNATDPRGFAVWLQRQGHQVEDNSFVPRRLFNEYVTASYHDALAMASDSGIEVDHVPEPAVSISPRDTSGVAVKSQSGRDFGADAVMLSPGVGRPLIPPATSRFQHHPRFFDSPYSHNFDAFLEGRQSAHVLVLGTKLSGIDAVKTCLQHNATAAMASPSAELPAVRTALTLRSPFPITRDAFTELSTSPAIFRHGLMAHLDRAGRDFGRPLKTQYSHATSPADRLREEIALAEEDMNLWQYAVGELIDLANDVWPQFPRRRMLELTAACQQWIKRYVSSMPLANAQALAGALLDGALALRPLPVRINHSQDGWRVYWHEKAPEHFDAIVCAAGHTPHPWSQDQQGNIVLGKAVGTPLRVDAKLQVVNGSAGRQSGIWAVGDVSANRYPVVNYMRSSVVQTHRVAEAISHNAASVP